MRLPTERVEARARFDEFVEDEHERLYKALYFVTGNREDAEDIAQDAFLKLWERGTTSAGIADPTGYLFRVALNGFRMRRRRAAIALRRLAPVHAERDAFAEAEMRADVRDLLLGLTPRQRAALLLVDLLGYPSEQAARILRVRPSTVRNLASQVEGLFERRKERGMPDVQKVYRMATQKVRPDEGFVDRQQDHQRRRARNRKVGALALVAAIGIAAAAFVIREGGDGMGTQPAVDPTPPPVDVPGVDYLLDLETGEMTPLPIDGDAYAVSPDGSMLAYMGPGEENINDQIFVANLDGSSVRQVTNHPGGAGFPAWSPDGSTIVYEGGVGAGLPYEGGIGAGLTDVFVIDVATGETRQVTQGVGRYSRPSFAPDGRTILFTQFDLAHWPPGSLWTVPTDGGEPTKLRSEAAFGSFSPDGSTIAFHRVQTTLNGIPMNTAIWVADADGSNSRQLGGWTAAVGATWSPDGTRIVATKVAARHRFDNGVYVIDVATGRSTRFGTGTSPTWFDNETLDHPGLTPYTEGPGSQLVAAELLIDCEEDRTLRAVLVGMTSSVVPQQARVSRSVRPGRR